MRNRTLWTLSGLSATVLMLCTQNAGAVTPLSAKELAVHCAVYPETEGADAQFCIRYIQGFVDGAVATDKQVMLNVEAELGGNETFMQRVFRTRGKKDRGVKDEDSSRAAQYAEYCLGDPVPLLEVVDKVATNLRNREQIEEGILARAVVYGVLREHYPCKAQKPTP